MAKKYKLKELKREPEKSFKINYEAELNEAQLKAVEITDGPVLVIAGAGTGKTRTLVYRVARLVESGINPASILLLTFTRRAAYEMLRKYAGLIGLNNNFTILDRSDAEDAINIIRTQLGFHKKKKDFQKKQPF